MDDSVRLRQATADDHSAIVGIEGYVFHHDLDDEARELDRRLFEPERSLVADDDGTVVGHTTALTRDLTVPGAVLPAAHVTGVGVLPTHRRRGLLTAMMHRQLTEIAEAGRESLAVLWASETTIYPRFGYGPAATRLQLNAMTREVRITPAAPAPRGRLRLVEPAEAVEELKKVYERARPRRIGWSSRPGAWWDRRVWDPSAWRDGATTRKGVLFEGPDGPEGYAMWRIKDDWDDWGPNAQVRVTEIVADDPGVYAELWRFLFGIDLARSATYDFAALDEPLQYLVDEPRRLGRGYGDALWIRLVDLPAALEARRYLTPFDVVIEVTDPLITSNSGRWRLTAGADKATCVRTTDPADLACSITELGAVYLGGTTLGGLHAAGRVQRLSGNFPAQAFAWERLPNPIEVF
ncbi:GNAT family N-acetyltransferase [Actinoplanes sp. NPDC026619]|uniref:GNAT family N-acetyltransferase n=1 Tax=Actinoplanes sp. NPDC026619 TaxID=3155798 RepID=UPI0033CE306C